MYEWFCIESHMPMIYSNRALADLAAPNTFPIIDANIHNLSANHLCGPRGSAQSIATTQLDLAPRELSTVAGPLRPPENVKMRAHRSDSVLAHREALTFF